MMKDVRKLPEGGVIGVQLPIFRVLGQVQRQWAVRAEQAEEVFGQPMGVRRVAGAKCRQRRWCKCERRLLAQPNGLVHRARGLSEPRFIRVQTFDEAQNGEEVEFIRLRFDCLQRCQSV